jgi:hypothetical protein
MAVIVVLALGCGGAQQGTSAKSTDKNGTTGTGESIADIAGRDGLPTLGGGGQGGGGAATSLRLEMVDKENPIHLDGVPKEWTLVPAHTVAKGNADAMSFRCALAYDAQNVYFAGEVTGVKLRHLRRFTDDEDHASLVVAAPNSSPVEVTFFPGKPGETAGVVRVHGRDVPGAKIIEADSDKGYTFEAELPWSAIAPPNIRVALRGIARFHNAGAIVATGSGDAANPRDMPALPTESEEALIESFLVPKGMLATAPKFELLADIRGDVMKERVAVYDRYITVMGPNYRGGKEYFFRDLGSDIEGLEARDVTGRGKQDLVIRRKMGGQDTREWLDVWSFFDDEPTTVFSHEISVTVGSSKVTNAVHVASKEIDVSYDPAVGFDATSYRQPRAIDTEPVLLPWGPVKSQVYRFDGSKFVKAKEVSQASTVAAVTTSAPTVIVQQTTTTPRPPELHAPTPEQLVARYRSDRGVADSVRPRVDLALGQNHVLLMGRDIVVYGPTFKGGTAYAYMTLSQFADAGDIEEVTVRAPFVAVRGVRHANATSGTIDVETMFLYDTKNDALTRVFGIETSRAQGHNRVQGDVQVLASGGRYDSVMVRPGRTSGWTQQTYPFAQEQPGSGALEPLLLPWGGIDHLRYTYNGSTFTRAQ